MHMQHVCITEIDVHARRQAMPIMALYCLPLMALCLPVGGAQVIIYCANQRGMHNVIPGLEGRSAQLDDEQRD
jgi:hypothetical protein